MSYKYGFIGCGNMGGALARAVVKTAAPESVILGDKDSAKASALANELGTAEGDIISVASSSEYIFIGVKPQMLAEMFAEIKDTLAASQKRFVLVSMAAGVSIESIKEFAGGDYPVIRIMPNLPASVGEGMILYTTDDKVTDEEVGTFVHDMQGSGKLDKIDEKLIDAASAISGCGPAFIFMLAEALADGGVLAGLPRDKALLYAKQMIKGSAELMLCSDKHPEALKDAVCSPGGTTIEGVRTLESGAFRSVASEAVIAAYKRTKELGRKS